LMRENRLLFDYVLREFAMLRYSNWKDEYGIVEKVEEQLRIKLAWKGLFPIADEQNLFAVITRPDSVLNAEYPGVGFRINGRKRKIGGSDSNQTLQERMYLTPQGTLVGNVDIQAKISAYSEFAIAGTLLAEEKSRWEEPIN
jgi:hypothetical protein